jgi:hypothetical protein
METPAAIRWIDSPNAKGPIARMQMLWKSSLYFSSEEGAFYKFMEEFDLSGLKIPYPCPCSHEDFEKGMTAAEKLIDMLKRYQNEEEEKPPAKYENEAKQELGAKRKEESGDQRSKKKKKKMSELDAVLASLDITGQIHWPAEITSEVHIQLAFKNYFLDFVVQRKYPAPKNWDDVDKVYRIVATEWLKRFGAVAPPLDATLGYLTRSPTTSRPAIWKAWCERIGAPPPSDEGVRQRHNEKGSYKEFQYQVWTTCYTRCLMDDMDHVDASTIAAEASTWAIGTDAEASRRLFSSRKTTTADITNMCAEVVAAAKATLQRRTAAIAAVAAASPSPRADGSHGPVSYLSKLIIKPVKLGFSKLRSALTKYEI